jgi:hypothetical protein
LANRPKRYQYNIAEKEELYVKVVEERDDEVGSLKNVGLQTLRNVSDCMKARDKYMNIEKPYRGACSPINRIG